MPMDQVEGTRKSDVDKEVEGSGYATPAAPSAAATEVNTEAYGEEKFEEPHELEYTPFHSAPTTPKEQPASQASVLFTSEIKVPRVPSEDETSQAQTVTKAEDMEP